MKEMKLNEIKQRIHNLMNIECKTTIKRRSDAIKANDDQVVMVCQSYLLGLARITEVLDGLFKELKNVR